MFLFLCIFCVMPLGVINDTDDYPEAAATVRCCQTFQMLPGDTPTLAPTPIMQFGWRRQKIRRSVPPNPGPSLRCYIDKPSGRPKCHTPSKTHTMLA